MNTPPTLTINLKGALYSLSTPLVMGILNITPDSFFEDSRKQSAAQILDRVAQIVTEGGQIIDIGAYSSRPHAEHVSEMEELKRVDFALTLINKEFPGVILSVDTFRSKVAERAVKQFGVAMINDISAGEMDPNMFQTVADLQIPYCIMHMQGTPQTMQNDPHYEDITKEVMLYLAQRVAKLKRLGVNDILIDPGFGFGKTVDHNYQLLRELEQFQIFELPVLVGLSRKSMISKLLQTDASKSLNGTTVLHTLAIQKGAHLLRVHDVRQAVETIQLVSKVICN